MIHLSNRKTETASQQTVIYILLHNSCEQSTKHTMRRMEASSTYCALAPEDVSLLFSDDVLKSTPPNPILGAGADDTDAEVDNKEPSVSPPPPRVV